MIVCPTCHCLHKHQDCVLKRAGKDISKICDFVEFPLHPHINKRKRCGTQLMKQITLKGKEALCVKKLYCYKPIKAWLSEFLGRPNFYGDCEKWRKREHAVGYYRDIYDGKV